jgi:hypothetical protein
MVAATQRSQLPAISYGSALIADNTGHSGVVAAAAVVARDSEEGACRTRQGIAGGCLNLVRAVRSV